MDGLSVSNYDRMLKTGKTVSELRREQLQNAQAELGPTAPGQGMSFADTLKTAVDSVNQISTEADKKMQKLATGETKNIPEVLIAVEKANVAFKLLLQVRNKIIDAYQEVMKMQV